MDQEDRKREVKADTMAMKYIFADVDGTLGIGGIGIPEKNRLAIRKYVEEGGSFGVCTGRSPDSVKGFIGDLPINIECGKWRLCTLRFSERRILR